MALTKVTPGMRTLGTDEVTTDAIKDDAITNAEIKSDAAIPQSKLTEVTAGDLASTLDLSSKTVTLAAGAVTPHVTAFDDNSVKEDVAVLGFKIATSESLVKYNLSNQTVDVFEDASGVDASASTNEIRNSNNYYSAVTVGSYVINDFTSTGASTWTCPASTSRAEILIVAGGGAGGSYYYAGGGGAGGIVHDSTYAVTAGVVYDITVGAGGSTGWGAGNRGGTGSDSVFNVNAEGGGLALTAGGGGGGGSYGAAPIRNGKDGGSGGGAGPQGGDGTGGSSTQASFTGATSYGNDGGSAGGDESAGSGGGGAGEAGNTDGSPSSGSGGYGGDGVLFSTFTSYGVSGYFGGGGGGGSGNGPAAFGPGGTGGGGNGAQYNSSAAVAGTANTGGGGGAGSNHIGTPDTKYGAAGGSGVVLLRHRPEAYNNLTLISNATTAQAAPTKADFVMTYTDGVGTTTVNTDLKAYASRDDGTTWTQLTLASQGIVATHTILTAHDLDISGQPSGTAMKYKITTHNQSATKETRVHAVSLGWS